MALATFSLRALHILYSLTLFVLSFWKRHTRTPPRPLEATRRRIPNHLAIVLVTDPNLSFEQLEKSLIETVVNVVGWCRTIGTKKVTVYEEHGRLLEKVHRIRELFSGNGDSSESEIDYPPTPPLSDNSESLPLSPKTLAGLCFGMNMESIHITGTSIQHACESDGSRLSLAHDSVPPNSLTLCLASRQSSKQAIATVACLFASRQNRKSRKTAKHTRNDGFKLSVDILNASLEADNRLSSPDFLILHSTHAPHTPLELHGFPPWHIRLTEIYHNTLESSHLLKWLTTRGSSLDTTSLDELSFRQALDEFAAAEMRFGR